MKPVAIRRGALRLEEVVAVGGFATVYRGYSAADPHEVAVKVARAGDRDPGFAVALKKEAELLQTFAYQHVVRILPIIRPEKQSLYYDRAVELPGAPWFFLMEYLAGGTLEEYLGQVGKLDVPEAAAIALIVARALNYTHKKGYAHNDLKLENIVFREPVEAGRPFTPVLIDFGIATRVQLQIEAGATYVMAPEQLERARMLVPPELAREPDLKKVDVWMLGVVLYRMLGGRLPFSSRNDRTLTERIMTTHPTALTQLSPAVPREINDLVVNGCLAKLPASRPSIVELGRRLKPLAANVTASVPAGKAKRQGWLGFR